MNFLFGILWAWILFATVYLLSRGSEKPWCTRLHECKPKHPDEEE